MSRICAITGKRPKTGGRIIHKGVSKKAEASDFNSLRLISVNLDRISKEFACNYLRGKLRGFGYRPKQLRQAKSRRLSYSWPALLISSKPNKDGGHPLPS